MLLSLKTIPKQLLSLSSHVQGKACSYGEEGQFRERSDEFREINAGTINLLIFRQNTNNMTFVCFSFIDLSL